MVLKLVQLLVNQSSQDPSNETRNLCFTPTWDLGTYDVLLEVNDMPPVSKVLPAVLYHKGLLMVVS